MSHLLPFINITGGRDSVALRSDVPVLLLWERSLVSLSAVSELSPFGVPILRRGIELNQRFSFWGSTYYQPNSTSFVILNYPPTHCWAFGRLNFG